MRAIVSCPLKGTDKDNLTEVHGFPWMPWWALWECCKCLRALRESWVETKIKCHHRAVRSRLTESRPARNFFSQPRKPLCKALRHLSSSSSVSPRNPQESKIKIYLKWLQTIKYGNGLGRKNRCINKAKHAAGERFWVDMKMNKAPAFLTSVSLSFFPLKTHRPLHLRLLLWAINSP